MGSVLTCGPIEAMVISGGPGCAGGNRKKKYIIGGWGWAWSCVTDVQKISLQIQTVNPISKEVLTIEGVPLFVTGVAQIKIMTDPEFLHKACEQFLGKTKKNIADAVLETMEGHLRAILGTLTVEEVYRDRELFARRVREVASPDVSRMGVEIISFVIKDIFDEVTYLKSLGKSQTAVVKRDAAVGIAEAHRDAGVREAECDKERMYRRYIATTQIADAHRALNLKESEFKMEATTEQAKADLAFQVQTHKTMQLVRAEEVMVDVVERRKMIDIEVCEIKRKETELVGSVRCPAEAESFRIEQIAEGQRRQHVAAAQGSADATRIKGDAEAIAIEAVGKSEAEQMRMKAQAFKQYGDAAQVQLILDRLPVLASLVSAPLTKIDNIVIVGEDTKTSEISKLVSHLPPAVQALTGVDLTEMVSDYMKGEQKRV